MKHLKARFMAFLKHLGLSAIVAGVAIACVFFVWYPAPLQEAQGVTQIFILLLAIDISIGPLITLMTYKPTAAFLKFDLPVIVLLQTIALCYGMYTVFYARPAFIVFNRSHFSVVRVLDLDKTSLNTALANHNQAAQASFFSPRWVATVLPKDTKRLNEVFFSNQDWNQLPESFIELAQAKPQLLAKARSLNELRAAYEKKHDGILRELNAWQSQIKWLPLLALNKNMIVLINTDSGEVVTILDIDPFFKK